MTGRIIQLTQAWEVGELISGGGFGQVYRARSGKQVAALKLVPKDAGADRELLFADLGSARNVVPTIDSGETDEHWVIVMPLAKKTLRAWLDEADAAMAVADAVLVLGDVAVGLSDLSGVAVHRDLKPENILLLDGHWCLADFGIARYAEATTAPDTRKHAMTPPYAAPEQWRAERATSATDVYALGVIAYELLTGTRPFAGPTLEDFREQHLHEDAPPLADVPKPLASLIEECLLKAPAARPSAENILGRLERMSFAASSR